MNLLGLQTDTTKIETKSKYQTFCNLCQRKVERDESVYTWPGTQFVIHLNCNEARDRMHLTEFKKIAKNKKKKNKEQKLTPAQNPRRGVPVVPGRGWRDVR